MRNKTVYVGSVWHDNSDPVATVIALEYADCEKALDRIRREEYTDMNNNMECEMCQDDNCDCSHQPGIQWRCLCEALNDLCDTGPMPYTLAEIKRDVIYHGGEWRERLHDLLVDGIAYL